MTLSLTSLAKRLLIAAAAVTSLHAATVSYTVNNFTLSGGDPVFSIASDVTFNSLALRETFADSTDSVVMLFDATGKAQTSLSTSTISLSSGALNTVDPRHGAIVSATLTGEFSTTSLSIVTSFGGTPVTVTVSPEFRATLPLSGSSVNIFATGSNGAMYAAGTFDGSVTGAPAVPEPGTFAIGSVGLLGLAALLRRRAAK